MSKRDAERNFVKNSTNPPPVVTLETPSTSCQSGLCRDTGVMVTNIENDSLPSSDMVLKLTALKVILHLHEYMIHRYKVKEVNNIDTVALLTEHIEVIINKLRQDQNGSGGLRTVITDATNFTVGEKSVLFSELRAEFLAIIKLYNVEYLEGNETFIGMLSTYLGFIAGYKARFNEVRFGFDRVCGISPVDPAIFGMRRKHHVLLSGISFNPRLQYMMKESLGPATVILNLVRKTRGRCQDVWKKVFCQQFKLLPDCVELANLLAGSGSAYQSVIGHLCDIALLGITKQSHKIMFPASFFLTVARLVKTYATKFSEWEIPQTQIEDADLHDAIKKIKLSEFGAYRFYAAAANSRYILNRTKDMNNVMAQQAVFHAVWGTVMEDLGLLGYMTSRLTRDKFMSHREFGKAFAEPSPGAEYKASFELINFLKINKLIPPSKIDDNVGGRGKIMRSVAFGMRYIPINVDSEIMKLLHLNMIFYPAEIFNTPQKFIQMINEMKNKIVMKKQDIRMMRHQLTAFYEFNMSHPGEDYGTEINERAKLTGQHFFGYFNSEIY